MEKQTQAVIPPSWVDFSVRGVIRDLWRFGFGGYWRGIWRDWIENWNKYD